jgi:TM2 domain-containing membrane protein YozV
MTRAVKGALLSGAIFPGAGQLWLKCYLRGIALIVLTSACLAVIARSAGQQAFRLLEKMEAEGGAVDMMAMLKSAGNPPDDLLASSASTLLVVCWLLGMIDAYLAGRKRDLAEQTKDREQERRADRD